MDDPNAEVVWLPLDTAPRDGTVILARFMGGIVTLAWWNKERKSPTDPYWFCGVPSKCEVIPCVQPREWLPL